MTTAQAMVVHIGLPKTATTLLQRGLFARHSQIEFLGKRAGPDADRRIHRCRDAAADRLCHRLFWDPALTPDAEESRRIHREEVAPGVADGGRAVYSFEGLGASELARREAIAQNLRDVFDDCRVVIGIRRPLDLVEAVYLQRLERYHFDRAAARLDFLRSPSQREWLEAVAAGGELADHLDYARTIRIFSDALGRDHVGVFPIEELRAEPSAYAARLCRFLDVDPVEGLRLLGDRRDNPRIRQRSLDRMTRVGRGFGRMLYGLSGRSLRRRLVGMGATGGPAARLAIDDGFRDEMAARTREGNRWIAEAWRLPLTEWGYPV